MQGDDSLVSQARAGRQDAFHRLYQEHREAVYRLAFRYTRSREEAEDIMQETFSKAFLSLGRYEEREGSQFRAWLISICHNCTVSHWRRQRSRRADLHVSLDEAAGALRPGEANLPVGAREEARRLLDHAVAQLSPRQRLIFDLRHGQDYSIEEVALLVACSQSTVKTLLARSKKKLQKILCPILEES